MENLVVGLETAKKLKAAGYAPAEVNFFWSDGFLMFNTHRYDMVKNKGIVAAPTAQEIADQLPREFELYSDCDGTYWAQHVAETRVGEPILHSGNMHKTIAEALALLWLALQDAK